MKSRQEGMPTFECKTNHDAVAVLPAMFRPESLCLENFMQEPIVVFTSCTGRELVITRAYFEDIVPKRKSSKRILRKFTIVCADGVEIPLGTVGQLFSARAVKLAIFKKKHLMIPRFPREEWESLVEKIFRRAFEEEEQKRLAMVALQKK
jgi:hypothetical protein